MTASALTYNAPALAAPFDAGGTNSVAPSPAQIASGFIPNVDNVAAEQQNYLHKASTSLLWVMQQLGLMLPFNPDGFGASLVDTPKGGIVSLSDSVTGDTEFYVALNDMPVGYTDPSLDPANWVIFRAAQIAKYVEPYADVTGTPDAILADYPNVIYPVLQDGTRLTIDTTTPNTTTTPTFAPTLNGSLQTARTIVKSVNGLIVPVAPGDIIGVCIFTYHATGTPTWELINPPRERVLPGTVIAWAGATAPNGYLQLPTSLTNISRTAYAALFAAIGTQWGAGDGSTTFGLPSVPAGYAMLQASGLGVIGVNTAGAVISHNHTQNAHTHTQDAHSHTQNAHAHANGFTQLAGNTAGYPYAAATSPGYQTTAGYGSNTANATATNQNTAATNQNTTATNNATGGAANLPAGVGFMLCIKY